MYKLMATVFLLCTALSLPTHANPMRPDNYSAPKQNTSTVVRKAKPASFSLSDIAITGDLRFATINNKTLTLNDQISGFKVTQIEAEFVVLAQGSTTRTLYLKTPGSFKIVPSTEDSPSE
ncbi:hypothetical protein QWZ13_17060 [Reinekea marina]|uniref:MSHA biogenesis protein MshK n=1 Tax=Reinekea marina TaxID=1310421 RepID=A0ABV7WPJ2_9GAMM|nr:hypothetical protein [Reinekea marina]MDN3650617.1 hypothetical protein [Reinekea marina]